ncbi:MAG TPA: hypothetical protein VH062_14125 [Polyangiaceae bacterium]|nr:hypothetical protein [Polyangiaceae bacterium]
MLEPLAILVTGAALLVGGVAHADKPKAPPAATAPTAAPAGAPAAPEHAATNDAKAAAKAGAANVVGTEENKEGVKTYKFGAVEVEGRLRSPQLTYFLRRVRAEFSAGDLGHRSFMRELAETTRHPSFR